MTNTIEWGTSPITPCMKNVLLLRAMQEIQAFHLRQLATAMNVPAHIIRAPNQVLYVPRPLGPAPDPLPSPRLCWERGRPQPTQNDL